MHYQWITRQSELTTIINALRQNSINALDTEFIKVDTLYPILGVLQMNLSQQIYLLDGQLDLTQLWPALFSAKQNIFHACGEDVDLIYHYSKQKPLTNIFDTQIGMAFLGYGMQVGYQAALNYILNIQVDKDQTRSDWLARPLSKEQELYAATDVYYLPELAERIKQQLMAKGLYQYALQDCLNYCQSLAIDLPITDIYLDMANYRHSARQLMQLKQITTWREQLAKQLNKPRSYIIKNNAINTLLERTPKTMQQLLHADVVKPAIYREFGKQILKLLNELPAAQHWPTRLARPFLYRLDGTKEAIEQKIKQVSADLNLPAEVLMRKKWLSQINSFVANQIEEQAYLNDYLRGWRYTLITQPLIEIMQYDRQSQSVDS